jgi:hypothetical protein
MFGDEHTVNPAGTWILKSVHRNVVVYFHGGNRNIVWLLNTVFHPKSGPVQEAKYYRLMHDHCALEFYKHLKGVAATRSVPTADYWEFWSTQTPVVVAHSNEVFHDPFDLMDIYTKPVWLQPAHFYKRLK